MLAVGWLARAAFILLSSPRARSTDVFSWIAVAHELRAGANPYETTTFLNWPPLWLVVIWALDHVSRALWRFGDDGHAGGEYQSRTDHR